MNWLALIDVPLTVIFTVLIALLLGLAAQRLLGARLGPVRLLATGLFATITLPLITLAIVRRPAADEPPDPHQIWFLLLAAMCTLFASMVFIVVVEAFAPLGSIPPATAWGPGVRGRWRRTRRYWQIVRLGLRHGLGPFLRGRHSGELESAGSRARLGRALRTTLNSGGTTFVKMGQILSTRVDSLPPEIADELAKLRDAATPVPWPDVERVVREELGGSPDDVFAEFDRTPLAAASIGQVHTARLRSGAQVVVKVQRPGIRPIVERDLDIAARLGARLETTTTWGRNLGTRTLAEGLGTAVREELDYRIEAENILAVARARRPGVRLPMPHLSLSTDRVLVMDRLHGVAVSDAGPLIDRLGLDHNELATTILDTLLHQILVDGVFHADPHAGNIFILEDGGIGLLDLGSVGRIDGALRESLERMLIGIQRGDPLAATDALLEIVPNPDELDELRLERDLGRLIARYGAGSSAGAARMLPALFRLIGEHRLQIPAEMAAVFRCLGTAEGTLRELSPGFDLVTTSQQLARSYVSDRLAPDELKRAASDELLAMMPMLRRLPRRLERIAAATERGRLTISLGHFSDEGDRAWLTRNLHDALVTVLAATLGIMAVLLLGTEGGPEFREGVDLHALIGYNLLVISGILGLRVLVQVFRRRVPAG